MANLDHLICFAEIQIDITYDKIVLCFKKAVVQRGKLLSLEACESTVFQLLGGDMFCVICLSFLRGDIALYHKADSPVSCQSTSLLIYLSII